MSLLWVDVETTGLDPEWDFLLEVGIIATDEKTLEVLDSIAIQISHKLPLEQIRRTYCSALVNEMHEKSELWIDIEVHGIDYCIPGGDINQYPPQEKLLEFCKKYAEPGTSPMCGSTVQFDRAFLKNWMPELEKHFHYRNIDVSTLKELAHRWNEFVYQTRPDEKNKLHRALSDLDNSIAEMKHYQTMFLRRN